MVKLTKSHVSDRLYVTPGMISNGCWMLPKADVINAALFGSEELCKTFAPKADVIMRDSDESTNQVLAAIGTTAWTVTPIQMEITGHRQNFWCRVLVNAAGTYALVQTAYADVIEAGIGSCLHGNADGVSAMRLGTTDRVIMPVRDHHAHESLRAYAQAYARIHGLAEAA